jgi:putative glutamine amidotransferase
MKQKVKIAVTGPDEGGFLAWQFTKFSLFLVGAKAIRTTPSHPINLNEVDGIIFGGGSDINPALYHQKREKETKNIDKKRDSYEIKLLKKALQKQMPILGICRGMQLINITLGGTLYQHIFNLNLQYEHKKTPFAYKKVFIKTNTKLYSIFKQKVIIVNSIHHQAVSKLGKNLIISAYDENKIVQAIESIHYPFLVGVQWHPEYMINDLLQRRLFKKFVQFARNFSQNNKNY